MAKGSGSSDRIEGQEPKVRDRDFVHSLANGLKIILAFGRNAELLTIAEIAKSTGLTRARARRALVTLEDLGYVERNGRVYQLTAQTLELGFPLYSAIGLGETARPYLRRVRDQLGLSCTMAVLDNTDIAFIAQAPGRCVMSATVGIGARLPAFATAAGRVLLSAHPDNYIARKLGHTERPAYTKWTKRDVKELVTAIKQAREQDFCVVEHELEEGLISVAVPVRDSSGATVAAINVSTHSQHQKAASLSNEFLPIIREAADQISRAIAT